MRSSAAFHSEALFEFLWCPVCGHEEFSYTPFGGVFCKHCNTQVELQKSRETRGYEEAVLACFDTDTTWNLHVDEKLRRDLPDGSARVKIFGAPGAYEVDWWSPKSSAEWEPVKRGEFDDVEDTVRRDRVCKGTCGDRVHHPRTGERTAADESSHHSQSGSVVVHPREGRVRSSPPVGHRVGTPSRNRRRAVR